ncbi:hypothetical protein GCK32_011335 [Trichostrongylus colubriformis]|uniref:Uncharacterized protein n=1 Tax=Trichostrongylus colubriformis TaxID=6319 RepID=A0AAN8FSX6_TRICO
MHWFILACLAVACLVQVQARYYRWTYRPNYRTSYYSRSNYLSRSTVNYSKCHRSGSGYYCFANYHLPANCMSAGKDTVVCGSVRNDYHSSLSRRRRRRRNKMPHNKRPPFVHIKRTKQKTLKSAKQKKNKKNSKVAKSSKGGKSD